MINKALFVTCLLAAGAMQASPVYASCKSKTIFSCTTTKGKVVEVCDAGPNIQYSFGKKGATPEMAIAIPRRKASTYQWDGMGSGMTYTVRIPNGNTVYEVFSSADRNTQEISSGINVEIGGKQVATLTCKPETVIDNIEGAQLPPAA